MADGKTETALGLGERLRSARKARALTLEQAAFALRLEAPVVRALEEERYDALGASVFVRGHLRAYAKLLGLSEEAVLAAYRAADPTADAPPKVTRELEKPLSTTPGPLALAAAVVFVLIAMLVLFLLRGGPEPARPRPVGLPIEEPAPTVDLAPTLMPETAPEPGPAAVEPVPAPAGAPDPTPPAPGGSFE
jgi:transcriptional regulator with XRE-family HTH domain